MSLFLSTTRIVSQFRQRAVHAVKRWSSGSREDLRRSWYLDVDTQVSQLPVLSRSTTKVYHYLINVASRDGFCEPSPEDVANECLLAPSAATRAIKDLQRLRLLVSVFRVGRWGRNSRAYYVVKVNRQR